MLNNIASVIALILSVGSFIVAFFQYKNKGILFNNAYLLASGKKRKEMNKKPYYRQSAVVFSTIGLMLLLTGLWLIANIAVIIYIVIGLAITMIIYVVISTVRIEKKKTKANIINLMLVSK